MAVQSFGDRFTYANPAFAALLPTLDSLSNEQLEAASPSLKVMADMVRRHSILLRSTRTAEIYRVITEQSDPRIGLRLAAARNAEGYELFPDLQTVKEAMFGPADPLDTNFVNDELNIFVDGIRRVSVALAASWLVGQFAQLEEQRRHGEVMEKQALADLDFLLKTYEQASLDPQVMRGEARNQAFYFEDAEVVLSRTLVVEVYIPNLLATNWAPVGTYAGTLKTATLVADLCDTVNNLTLNIKQSNVIAAPVLAGVNGLHRVDVEARVRDSVVSYELISVRMRFLGSGTEELPFRWGVDPSNLRPETLNSSLVQVNRGSVQTISTFSSLGAERPPQVLYFRRGPLNGNGDPVDAYGNVIPTVLWANANLTFRVSPTMTADQTVVMTRATNPNPTIQAELDGQRFSEVPLVLLNQLFQLKPTGVRALGALIRNDDPQQAEPMAALELVAYTLNELETWMILDVVELPLDIQMAVGDLRGPITSFSNKPRSIRVPAEFVRGAGGAPALPPGAMPPSLPRVVSAPESAKLLELRSRLERLERGSWL